MSESTWYLLRVATEEEAHDVRVALIFNLDNIEVCNVLGAKRGKHKRCGCQMAIANLPTSERFKMENILLPVLAGSDVYKKHGMARVLCGVDKDGVQHDEPNFAADMRKLDEGVWVDIPDDISRGVRPVRLKAWVIVVGADYLAAQSILPFVESCGEPLPPHIADDCH